MANSETIAGVKISPHGLPTTIKFILYRGNGDEETIERHISGVIIHETSLFVSFRACNIFTGGTWTVTASNNGGTVTSEPQPLRQQICT
jgi:hypothetical protein